MSGSEDHLKTLNSVQYEIWASGSKDQQQKFETVNSLSQSLLLITTLHLDQIGQTVMLFYFFKLTFGTKFEQCQRGCENGTKLICDNYSVCVLPGMKRNTKVTYLPHTALSSV